MTVTILTFHRAYVPGGFFIMSRLTMLPIVAPTPRFISIHAEICGCGGSIPLSNEGGNQ